MKLQSLLRLGSLFFKLYIVHKQETMGPRRDVANGDMESWKPSAFIFTSLGSPGSACSPLATPRAPQVEEGIER